MYVYCIYIFLNIRIIAATRGSQQSVSLIGEIRFVVEIEYRSIYLILISHELMTIYPGLFQKIIIENISPREIIPRRKSDKNTNCFQSICMDIILSIDVW